jgi:hypothetical protein
MGGLRNRDRLVNGTYGGVVSDDQHEPNRVLGFPVGRRPAPRPQRRDTGVAPHEPAVTGRDDQESQRVLGFPVDWFRQVNLGRLRTLARIVPGRSR